MNVPLLDPHELIDRAYLVSSEAHKEQKYGDEPYIFHVFEVTQLAMYLGYGATVGACGLLHDTIEDTDVTNDFLREQGFPESVLQGVEGVTYTTDNTLSAEDNRVLKIAKAMSNPISHIIKYCDSSVNFGATVLKPPTVVLEKYMNRYSKNIAQLREGLPSVKAVQKYVYELDGENYEGTTRSEVFDIVSMRLKIAKKRYRIAKKDFDFEKYGIIRN